MATTMTTARERSRMAELLGNRAPSGVQIDGEASALPPTMGMQFGGFMDKGFDAIGKLFPESNPYGRMIMDQFGSAPESAQRMADGETNVLADTRGPNPLNWRLKPEAVDMAGAMPFGLAGKAAGGLAGKAAGAGLGALGITGSSEADIIKTVRATISKEERDRMAKSLLDGRHHPMGDRLLDHDVEQHQFEIKNRRMPPSKFMDIEKMVGSHYVTLFGDRANAAGKLINVNGIPIDPVDLQGGPQFPRLYGSNKNHAENSIWSSGKTVINKIIGDAKSVEGDVFGIYSPMGRAAVDSNMMMTQALARQLKAGGAPSSTHEAIDRAIRSGKNAWAGFPGVGSPGLEKALKGATFEQRKKFTLAFANQEIGELPGAPNYAATRIAVTDPDMRNMPVGFGGQSIGLIDKSDPLIDNPKTMAKHGTYPVNLRGDYAGRLKYDTPFTIFNHDLFNSGKQGLFRSYYMSGGALPVTRQVADRVQKYEELLDKVGGDPLRL